VAEYYDESYRYGQEGFGYINYDEDKEPMREVSTLNSETKIKPQLPQRYNW
jgi:hypothetical protein